MAEQLFTDNGAVALLELLYEFTRNSVDLILIDGPSACIARPQHHQCSAQGAADLTFPGQSGSEWRCQSQRHFSWQADLVSERGKDRLSTVEAAGKAAIGNSSGLWHKRLYRL